MRAPARLGERLLALAALGALLFCPPLLVLFDRPLTLFGLPLPFLYLFVAWAALIALVAVVVERDAERDRPPPRARRED